jgi:hypothetical protein
LELRERMKYPVRVLAVLGHQEVEMGVEINPISKRLLYSERKRSK